MTKVLVPGAGGQIARRAVPMLADKDAELTLMLRDAGELADPPGHARVVQGDVLDRDQLDPAVRGQDIVYANLRGPRSRVRAWPPSSPISPRPRPVVAREPGGEQARYGR
jgi:putative NADH-flavin reductase